MSGLALYLLGPPRIELDGEEIHIGRTKAVALLAYLAVTGISHSREALATLLWPESMPSRARASLRRVLVTLRQALGEEWLQTEPETVGLEPTTGPWLDVATFQVRLSACQTHEHPSDEVCPDCVSLLTEAVELYRDDFLAGFTLPDSLAFDEWHFFQAERLRDGLTSALQRLVSWHDGRAEHEDAIAYARRWLELDPLHEPAHRELMVLYARANRQTAALRQYQLCEETLAQELDLRPSEETTTLYVRIRSGEAFEREPEAPALIPHNLPPQPTPFVGRQDELARIVHRLDDPECRLLTLVGTGGIGKTRLAIQAALHLIERPAERTTFAHGIWFVPLAAVSTSNALVPAIASVLNFSFHSGAEPKQQLLDYLRAKEMLLVLDNFEHLLPPLAFQVSPAEGGKRGGAKLVTDILATAPDVKILVTSREALNVRQEWFHPVEGMAFPSDDEVEDEEALVSLENQDAVALFLQCARRARPGFSLVEDARWVVRICRSVEGMPLAIELAAAWLKALPTSKIAQELEHGVDILTTSMRDLPPRHRSIRAVFDHSWNLLTMHERTVMEALSVFRGGFRGRAAQAVAGASLPLLAGLVEKSLLQATSEGRYQLHELLRQYAAEKLEARPQEWEAARNRHCEYFAAFLREHGEALKGARQQAALPAIEEDVDNARAAWNWAAERGQVERLDQAMEGLCLFYEWRGRYQEGEAACRTAAKGLAGTDSSDEVILLARILAWRSVFNLDLGRSETAGQLVEQSLAFLDGSELAGHDTRSARAFALRQMGNVAYWLGDRKKVGGLLEQSLALYRALGDRWGTAATLHGLGQVGWALGTFGKAEQAYRECLALRQASGDTKGSADTLFELSTILWAQGHLEEAERMARGSITLQKEIGDPLGLAGGHVNLGFSLMLQGRFAETHTVFEEAAAIANDLGTPRWMSYYASILGVVQMHLGQHALASAQAQMGADLAREAGEPVMIGYSRWVVGCLALAEEAYAEAQRLFQESVAHYEESGHSEWADAIRAGLGYAARGVGQIAEARGLLARAVRMAAENRRFEQTLFALPAVALLLADEGATERGVELYAMAARHSFVGNSRWFEEVAGKHIAAAAATLPPELVAAAQERGQSRELWETAAELLEEL